MQKSLRMLAITVIFLLIMSPLIMRMDSSAIDIGGGEESSVRVREYIEVRSDGVLILDFKVLYGISEFEGSDIYRPHAPVWEWSDFTYDNIKAALGDINEIDTIRHIFNDTISEGKKITDSQKFFVKVVLGIDTDFQVIRAEPRIIPEFKTIEVKMTIKPDSSAYTIAPLKFLSNMNFGGFPPTETIKIETAPEIDIQCSSIVLNHFLYPEGHRFSTETLYFNNNAISYHSSEDSIKVQKLPPFLSSTILYYLWIGAAVFSMIMLWVAGKKHKVRVNKGLHMWIAIGILCFFAFIPFHLYLSYLAIFMGLAYSIRKSRKLLPAVEKEEAREAVKEEKVSAKGISPKELVSLANKQPAQDSLSFAPPANNAMNKMVGYSGAYSIEKYEAKGPMENVVKVGMKIEYSKLKVHYTVYVENSTSHPIGDITIKPLVSGNHFIPDAVEKKISSIPPGESAGVTFELVPNGRLSNAVITSIITYFDSISNEYLTKEVPSVTTTITVPILNPVEINAVDWSTRMADLSRAEQTMEGIKLGGKVLFEMVTEIIRQMNMFALQPQISEAGGFSGDMRFYAEISPNGSHTVPARFGIQVIVTGDQRTSNLKIVVYAPDEAMLIGFYYHIIFQVADRMAKTKTEEYILLDRKAKSEHVKFPMNYEEMMYQVAAQVRKQFRQFTSQIHSPEDFEEIFPMKIEQVFLIDSEGGRLIMHVSKSKEEHIDSDVVGSMLTAIQDFVGDSFASTAKRREKLEELQYGDLTILIEHIPYVYLAVVVSGEKTAIVRKEMQELLERIYEKYKDVLKDWSGDKGQLEGIKPMIEEFIERCEAVKNKKEYKKARELLKECGSLLMEADSAELDTTQLKKQYVEARTMVKNGDYATALRLLKESIEKLKGLLKGSHRTAKEELIPEKEDALLPSQPESSSDKNLELEKQTPPIIPEEDDMEELPDEDEEGELDGGFPNTPPDVPIVPHTPEGVKPIEFDFGGEEPVFSTSHREKKMIECPACGKQIEDFWPECPYCGAKITG